MVVAEFPGNAATGGTTEAAADATAAAATEATPQYVFALVLNTSTIQRFWSMLFMQGLGYTSICIQSAHATSLCSTMIID